jgi:DivIVA domain-containing protein
MASDPSSPASIAVAEFTTGRRGYDQAEVRSFLQAVSLELSRAKEREASVATELEAIRNELALLKQTSVSRSSVDLDEATVASLLGEEAARVLTTAREGAAQLRARAEREIEIDKYKVAEAVERERADAAADAERVRAEAAADAERIRLEANDTSTAEVEAAKIQGRDMVFEARAYREKVMADLARRRDSAQQQLDVLNLQRGRLRSSFESVRTVLDEIRAELHDGELGPSPLDDMPSISGAFPVVARFTQSEPAPVYAPAPVELLAAAVPEPVVAVEPEPDTAVVEPVAVPEPEPEPITAVVEPEAIELDEVDEVEPEVVEFAEDEPIVVASSQDTTVEAEPAHDVADTAEPEAADTAEPEEHEPLAVVHELVRVRPNAPSRPAADDVFARLRASRVDDVGRLQESPSESDYGSDKADSARSVLVAERVDIKMISLESQPTPTPTVAVVADPPTAEPLAPAAEVIEARRVALTPIEESMARRLKRALADEQSEVLDKMRRKSKKATLDLADLFGSTESYQRRYVDAASADVLAAARAGALSLMAIDAAKMSDVIDQAGVLAAVNGDIVEQLISPLRARLERAFTDAGDDTEVASDQFRALYREWKTQRIDATANHAALAAHGRGALAALNPGTPVCWVVDGERPCAEGDDNVLAGTVPAGDDFPTGHRHAPAYPGCRCAIALASR